MSLRTAVIGGGTVSENHLSGLSQNPKTELVAICDLDEEIAREKARSYGIKAYFDVGELLAAENLDWVHVCTPPQTHLAVATQVLEAGIPALVEKPVTETIEQFEELASVADREGVPFSVVHNHKFGLVMRTVLEEIESGKLGDIRGVDLLYTGSTEPDVANRGAWNFELLGGEFEEGLPHPLYLGLNAGGLPRSEADVSAQTSLVGSYEMEFGYDCAQIQYVSESDALCTIKMLSGTKPVRILYVHGSESTLAADLVSQTLVRLDRDYKASPLARAQNNIDQIVDRVRGTAENVGVVLKDKRAGEWETAMERNGSYYQFEEEAEALLTGTEPPVSVDEARWTVKLQEAIRDSVRRDDSTAAEQPESSAESEVPSDD
ncbi:Gfo/Idh/MocA family protein [Halohasta litchfieldiae]|uniref:Predicted dehydrogenase n=1 Tax=Halohasta litchfieldiae TaxID=1073996 RepID=A0A1H6YA97_9EURY|nr:Gfo/Idh/MocA family oxidoreductase [Halohasta litchfieldiae]SEJ37406.1 Predicted dehydrogenase [Halohasta litchfieldiae]